MSDGKLFLPAMGSTSGAARIDNINSLRQLGRENEGKDSPKEIQKAAEKFEALLLHQMIRSMWSTVPSEGMLTGSREEGIYRDMLNEALAKSISEGKGIGIKDVIVQDMSKLKK